MLAGSVGTPFDWVDVIIVADWGLAGLVPARGAAISGTPIADVLTRKSYVESEERAIMCTVVSSKVLTVQRFSEPSACLMTARASRDTRARSRGPLPF